MDPPRLYVLYARRSSDSEDRQTLSIEQQLDVLRRLAVGHGYEITDELTESCSARQPGRPVFGELMKRVRKGDIRGILVWRLDRLARNMVDGGEIIYELSEGRLHEIVTPEATYTGTPDAKFMLALLFGQAAKFTDDLSAAVKRGNHAVFELGRITGAPPARVCEAPRTGRPTRRGTGDPRDPRSRAVRARGKNLEDDPTILEENVTVSEAWRRARSSDLTSRPTEGSLAHPVSLANIYTLLRNLFYTGKVVRGNESYDGEHQAMVAEAEIQRVQLLIKRKLPDRRAKLSLLSSCPPRLPESINYVASALAPAKNGRPHP